ncbi:hypothetical protein ACFS07_30480 [Undibacterium arcticum]
MLIPYWRMETDPEQIVVNHLEVSCTRNGQLMAVISISMNSRRSTIRSAIGVATWC